MGVKRVLVACEESQAVTIRLRTLGIDAFSCDLEPCSGGHPEWHLQADVLRILDKPWWAMVLAFPPCTHLCVSGAKHFAKKKEDGRQQQGIDFFMRFANAKCERIAIENPVGIMSSVWRKPDQIIQPYEYGHPARKATCLWLKGLPKLRPTEIVVPELYTDCKGRTYSKDFLFDKDGKWTSFRGQGGRRSKTYPGIADAMADQWGKCL